MPAGVWLGMRFALRDTQGQRAKTRKGKQPPTGADDRLHCNMDFHQIRYPSI